MRDTKDDIVENFLADDIDHEGYWHLNGGNKIDLLNVQLHLPDNLGHQWVMAKILTPEEFHKTCPLCQINLENGLIIVLETHYYLITRCCNRLFLYEAQDINKGAWI